MSHSRLVITIDTKEPVSTLRNILTDSNSLPAARKVINYFRALSAGARAATVNSGATDSGSTDAVAASQTATFSTAATALDTVTINGVVVTCVASSPTNNQFVPGLTASDSATNLAAAINASTTDALSGVVKASALGAVCTVTCLIPGIIGNSITIAKSSTAITLGGATLASGSGKLPVLSAFSY